jgi:esterase/lipase
MLKKIQENTSKQVEGFKEEAQKSLKELQENTTKQVMELNKITQDLKREVETIEKTKKQITLGIETRNHRCEHQQSQVQKIR